MYQFIYSATEDIFPDFSFENYKNKNKKQLPQQKKKLVLSIPVQILCERKF